MRSKLEAYLTQTLTHYNPWTNVYGLTRTILALSSALSLLLNPADFLFRPSSMIADYPPACNAMTDYTFYCLGGDGYINLKVWIAFVLYLVIASGWRPRLTGVLQWYLGVSYYSTTFTVEGGDHIASVVLLLLIPLTLFDGRVWHWERGPNHASSDDLSGLKRRLYGWVSILCVRLQISLVYLHAFFGKITEENWADGSSLFYWLRSPTFGAPSWLEPVTSVLIDGPVTLAMMTWGSLVIEWLLAAAIFMPIRGRIAMLVAGIAFHVSIGLMIGLASFSTTMVGVLVIYLWPAHRPIRWVDRLWHRLRGKQAVEQGVLDSAV